MSVEFILIPIAIAAISEMEKRKEKNKELSDYFCLGTKIKDAKLLEEALKIYGCENITTGENLETEFDQARIIFEKDENGIFNAVFLDKIHLDEAKGFVSDINDEYTKLVQEQVYQKLLKNATERNLQLESEEVKEDNSIVLTFALQEEKI
ncbi:MAG: hypothetical protein ABFC34_15220 [Methanobacterium sp.]